MGLSEMIERNYMIDRNDWTKHFIKRVSDISIVLYFVSLYRMSIIGESKMFSKRLVSYQSGTKFM